MTVEGADDLHEKCGGTEVIIPSREDTSWISESEKTNWWISFSKAGRLPITFQLIHKGLETAG